MDSFDMLSNEGQDHQIHTPMDFNNNDTVDDILPSPQTYDSPFPSSPPPPLSSDFASPFDPDVDNGVNDSYNDAGHDNIFVSNDPILPPPSEMMPEEDFAFREWRRFVCFFLRFFSRLTNQFWREKNDQYKYGCVTNHSLPRTI